MPCICLVRPCSPEVGAALRHPMYEYYSCKVDQKKKEKENCVILKVFVEAMRAVCLCQAWLCDECYEVAVLRRAATERYQ